ncbi:MAG: hypothetical protein JXA36_01410 [Coriobacteriia bacterium]|nr:hypothetical protein [Coriobacteriia bacterium]
MRKDRQISAASSLLAHPVIAAALGALLGVFMTLISRRASHLITPADPIKGFALVAAMMGLRFFLALVALTLYFLFAPDGLPVFGFVLGTSFIAGLGYEAVRVSCVRTTHTSV